MADTHIIQARSVILCNQFISNALPNSESSATHHHHIGQRICGMMPTWHFLTLGGCLSDRLCLLLCGQQYRVCVINAEGAIHVLQSRVQSLEEHISAA